MADIYSLVNTRKGTGTQWACDVVEDQSTEDGYRVVAVDPAVADGEFIANLARGLARPVRVNVSVTPTDGGNSIGFAFEDVRPGDPRYFTSAIRQVDGAMFSARRSA